MNQTNHNWKTPGRAILFLTALAGLLMTGCFTIPFLGGKSGPPSDFQPRQADFDRGDIFVGFNDNGKPIVQMRLAGQEVTAEKGLVVHVRILPTENFRVVNVFRGLRSINYYPIERRFHRLELRIGRKEIKMKVVETVQVKDMKPLDAYFEHSGTYSLLPDSISSFKLKFQDVDYWQRMAADSLDNWYAEKDQQQRQIQRNEQRNTLVDAYRQRQKRDETKTYSQLDSLYVTTNNAYVYLDETADSDILFTLNAGDFIDYGVSDGFWVEIPVPDTLQKSLGELFEKRKNDALRRWKIQENAARSRRGAPIAEMTIDTTLHTTAYILDVMVQKKYSRAVAWELQSQANPVDVPLFAQVLNNREIARQARLDSIAKAREDSVKAVQARQDSILAAQRAPDSSSVAKAAAKGAQPASTPADSAAAAQAAQAAAAAGGSQGTAAAGVGPSNGTGPGSGMGPASGTGQRRWAGPGPPPWANRQGGGENAPGDSTQSAPADSGQGGHAGQQAPPDSTAGNQQKNP